MGSAAVTALEAEATRALPTLRSGPGLALRAVKALEPHCC
jgi:hypothetical protein